MSDKSIISLTNDIIRIFPYVNKYQGPNPNSSMQDHVGTSLIFSLLGTVLFLVWWPLVFIEVGLVIYYAFIRELWIDRHKNKNKPKGHVMAQITERCCGNVLLVWLKLLILIG